MIWLRTANGLQIGNDNDYLTARHHVVGGIFLLLQVVTKNQMSEQTVLLKNAAILNKVSSDEGNYGGFS